MDPNVAPADDLAQVLARLDEIVQATRRENSRLAYFAALYRAVTLRVRDAVALGRFEDGPRMERLDVVFANRYLAAYTRYRQGLAASHCWAVAFGAAAAWRPLILQHLLLGMNAHINLDLGVAAAKVAPAGELHAMKADFLEITAVLGEMLDDVQDRLTRVSPWMGLLDRLGARNDEVVFSFGLRTSRALAWRTATVLSEVPADKLQGEIDLLDRAVAVLAYPISHPGRLLSTLLLLPRLREPSDVSVFVDALA